MISSKLLRSSSRPFTILGLPLVYLPRSLPRPSTPATTSSQSPSPISTPSSSSSSSPSPSPSPSPTPTPTPTSASTHSHPLILFQPLQPPLSPASGPLPYTTRILNYTSDTWLKLGQRDPKTWMYWFWKQGEGLMDKIEYEEWALKSVVEGQGVKIDKQGKVISGGDVKIPLLRPSTSLIKAPPMLPQFHRHLLHRIPYHRSRMYQFLWIVPITAPFAIVPIIPNFPMYYAIWRAWSHYKAYRGALYLESLVKAGLIVEKEDTRLDDIYKQREQIMLEAKGAVIAGGKGGENRAPDAMGDLGVSGAEGGIGVAVEAKGGIVNEREAETLPGHAKGEDVAPDGTSTPTSQLFTDSTSESQPHLSTSSSISSSSPLQSKSPQPLSETELSMRSYAPLLLTRPQVQSLAQNFHLQPNEIVDVNRAIEQGYSRAVKIDKENKSVQGQSKAQVGAGTKWRGNLHR